MSKASVKNKETIDFTERMLLSLAHDIVDLNETVEAVVVKIRAMAKAHRVSLEVA